MADVQKQVSLEQVIEDHIAGLSGYDIAEKYGIDTEKVKELIKQADDEGKFVPEGGASDPIVRDSQQPNAASTGAQPLVEGENPESTKANTNSKK